MFADSVGENEDSESTEEAEESEEDVQAEVRKRPRKKARATASGMQLALIAGDEEPEDSGVSAFRSNKKTGRKKTKDGEDYVERGAQWTIKEIVAGPRIVNMEQQFRVW